MEGASSAARACIRATFSASVPSFAWKMIPSSAGTRLSRVALRSWSQKNRASASRALSTRSLPAVIALPPSSGSVSATTMKRGAREPSFFTSEKYFWWWRMTVVSTSAGRSMKASSMRPMNTLGHSTKPATSAKSASSALTVSPSALASLWASFQIAFRRSAGSRMTWASSNLFLYSAKFLIVIGFGGARKRWPRVLNVNVS